MKILFFESFFGGSHKDFAQSVKQLSSHKVTLLTLSAHHWKWRQGGSSLALLTLMDERGLSFDDFDLFITTGLTDLNLLKSLTPLPPVLLYLHETQFHYPLGPGETMDYHYGLKDFTNMLAADKVVFNSHYHGETFFNLAEKFIRKMPDHKPIGFLHRISQNWDVIYPGFTPSPLKRDPTQKEKKSPVILWNHRWEHDKNPQDFYAFLSCLKEREIDFSLIMLGERFVSYPPVFDSILKEFESQIITCQYAESREDYNSYLSQADFAVSTSGQENFGISVVESIAAGAIPLLPNRLSYPEILPHTYHSSLLYSDVGDLTNRFITLNNETLSTKWRGELQDSAKKFIRRDSVSLLDQMCSAMAQ